jgi:lysyl-tRNA synthetase, class I
MSHFIENAIKSNAWPFFEAKRIIDNIGNKASEKGYILFETGYGPSGLPHIGTFAEVARTTMVMEAFKKISDIPTKLICFSDDMDGLRKVPSNLPNQVMLKQHIGKPLTSIPDPFGEEESYGHYMNKKLRSFLDRFGFEYEFYSSTKCYQSGMFDLMMVRVLEKYDEIMTLMLPTFREERKATYSPFMPICPKTGIVLQVPIERVSVSNKTVTYKDEQGFEVEVPVTNGHCKLQWKPDFGMRWVALDVDYEMYGKDHRPNAEIYSEICRILGGKPPVQFFYELFLNEEGAKISKSQGNSITIDEWLHYAPVESMSLFMYQSPTKAKRLHFDVIPKCVDEYLTFNKKFHAEIDQSKQLANPVYHIHSGRVPKIETYNISFGLLLNLASVCNPEDKSVLWGFISKYSPNANPNNAPYLDHLAEFAVNYYNAFIKANKVYLKPSAEHILILNKIHEMLNTLHKDVEAEQIQQNIYSIGTEANYENLRDYFKDLYQILLGQAEGPRLGSFIKLFGIEETQKLIKEKMGDSIVLA